MHLKKFILSHEDREREIDVERLRGLLPNCPLCGEEHYLIGFNEIYLPHLIVECHPKSCGLTVKVILEDLDLNVPDLEKEIAKKVVELQTTYCNCSVGKAKFSRKK